MNKNLLQINDNIGAVSDENGDIKVVSKESNDCDFEEILELENDLNYLQRRRKMCNKHLREVKRRDIWGAICSGFIIAGEVILCTALYSSLPKGVLVVAMGTFYGFAKVVSINICGTYVGRNFQKKSLTEDISRLEEKIPETEKELEKMKEKVKFKEKASEEKTSLEQVPETLNIEVTGTLDVKPISLTRKREY